MLSTQKCQRWRRGREFYRPAREPINPRRYGVELVDEGGAKRFVKEHHYSRSYPAARLRVGLYRRKAFQREALVGVAVFSVPMNESTVDRYVGIPSHAGVMLGRLVLLDDVEANGETWMLRRAFALLRRYKPEVRAVIAYADPVPRRTTDGALVKPGHVGTCYQAFNGEYRGRSKSRSLILAANGEVVSERLMSKVRLEERGRDYAERELLRLGAPRRRLLESGDAYVRRALASGGFRRMRHPGNHVYVWTLDPRGSRERPKGQYPKSPDREMGEER
jgi:hypothetical protein